MIVVDASVIVPKFLRTKTSLLAKAVMDRDRVWLVPPIWKYEFTNAVWKMRRSGQVDEWAARDALALAHDRLLEREIAVDQYDALRIAVALDISAYDAQYIALAEKYGVMCVTNDGPLTRKAQRFAIPMVQFAQGER